MIFLLGFMLPTTTGLFSLEFVGREEKPSEYQEKGPLLERNLGYGRGDVTWSLGPNFPWNF